MKAAKEIEIQICNHLRQLNVANSDVNAYQGRSPAKDKKVVAGAVPAASQDVASQHKINDVHDGQSPVKVASVVVEAPSATQAIASQSDSSATTALRKFRIQRKSPRLTQIFL